MTDTGNEAGTAVGTAEVATAIAAATATTVATATETTAPSATGRPIVSVAVTTTAAMNAHRETLLHQRRSAQAQTKILTTTATTTGTMAHRAATLVLASGTGMAAKTVLRIVAAQSLAQVVGTNAHTLKIRQQQAPITQRKREKLPMALLLGASIAVDASAGGKAPIGSLKLALK